MRLPSLIRRRAGFKAQRFGANWESIVERECALRSIGFTRIPDSCRVVGKGKLLRVKSPFDAILHYKNKSVFIDMKRSENARFSYSAVDQHQVSALAIAASGGGAGYLCNLAGNIIFFSFELLKGLKSGQGLGIEDGVKLGLIGSFDLRILFEQGEYFDVIK